MFDSVLSSYQVNFLLEQHSVSSGQPNKNFDYSNLMHLRLFYFLCIGLLSSVHMKYCFCEKFFGCFGSTLYFETILGYPASGFLSISS